MLRLRLSVAAFAACSALACAREAPSARAPTAALRPWVAPPGYDWPPRTVKKEDRMHPSARAIELSKTSPITSANRAALPSDTLVPGGEQCLARLREQDVRFEQLSAERGVDTPILIRGPLGGVEFWSYAGPMVVDCRMALALSRVAPEFAALGVTRVRFSGAYVYRTSKQGRLSLHAFGLAIDIHDVKVDGEIFSVSKDFERGQSCAEELPLLNRLGCRLRSVGLFRELLTPDYDADHKDHIHLGLAPLPNPERDTASDAKSAAAKTNARSLHGRVDTDRETSPQDLSSKTLPQIEAPRKLRHGRALRVKPSTTNARVARLRPDLEEAPGVSSDRLETESDDDSR